MATAQQARGDRDTIPAEPEASSATAGTEDLIQELLDRASAAAAAGDKARLAEVESTILRALVEGSERDGCSDDYSVFVAEVIGEMEALDDDVSDAVAEGGEPPEPGPVPEERVAHARQEAKEGRYDLPVIVNEQVTSLIEYYTGPHLEAYVGALQRAASLLPFVRETLRDKGLPEDLSYLPIVESAFNPQARSRARAQGLWQFMKGTAVLYDLRCDSLVDERNDPYLSTEAAASHLADLYQEFDDWSLALAAYNSGAGRVRRAIARAGGERDFWRIRRFLPRETRNYVAALWAVLVTAKNPTAFGLPHLEESHRCIARIPVEGALDLAVLADRSSLEEADLAQLNPALTYRMTPEKGRYRLAVPCDREAEAVATIASIPRDERVRRFIHTICRGDTLGVLASRYASSVHAIMAANHIRDARRLRIGQKLVIPRVPDGVAFRASVDERYTVRRGDTLFIIAKRFGTTVAQLQHVNGIDGTTIHPGDVLRVAD